MKNLILALSQANLPPNGIETILTEFEVWVDSKVLRSKEKLMIETITPLQRETDGIRNEVRFLAETMKQGFALMDERFILYDISDGLRGFNPLRIPMKRKTNAQ